jgi:hypothetical protein
LPDASRRLRVRFSRLGLFSPSLDGGLPLFELFNPPALQFHYPHHQYADRLSERRGLGSKPGILLRQRRQISGGARVAIGGSVFGRRHG